MGRHLGKSEISLRFPLQVQSRSTAEVHPSLLVIPLDENKGFTAQKAALVRLGADNTQEVSVHGLQSAAATGDGAWSSLKRISELAGSFQRPPVEQSYANET